MALWLLIKGYEVLVRPVLFTFPPETVHRNVAIAALKNRLLRNVLKKIGDTFLSANVIDTELAGMALKNPVGLAAGYDKDCEVLPGLTNFGFGYVTCGTVTRYPSSGNPMPRLVRDPNRHALTNSLGFPSKGLDAAIEQLSQDRSEIGDTPIVVSISGTQIEDIKACFRGLESLVDAIEINISSPNTSNLRLFHDPDNLSMLLDSVNEGRDKPLFVKMPPFPSQQADPDSHESVLSLADVCVAKGVEALTVANTQPVQDNRMSVGSGGLSGMPIKHQTTRMISETRQRVGDAIQINACGGIFTAEDAWNAILAGADTVQLFTSFVYKGPYVAGGISKGLAERLEEAYALDSSHATQH